MDRGRVKISKQYVQYNRSNYSCSVGGQFNYVQYIGPTILTPRSVITRRVACI